MGARDSVQPKQADLDLFALWIDFEGPPRNRDPPVVVASSEVIEDGPLDDLEVCGVKGVAVGGRPFLVLEVEREATRYRTVKAIDVVRTRAAPACPG